MVLAIASWGCRSQVGEPRPVPPAVPEVLAVETPGARGEATLLLMADIRGVLRPCGCTVELQKGGFDRLGPFLSQTRAQHGGSQLVHAGPLWFESTKVDPVKTAQRARQAEVATGLLRRVKLDVAGLSAVDLASAGDAFTELVAGSGVQLTAANLEPTDGSAFPLAHVVRAVGDLEVGFFALASPRDQAAVAQRARILDPTDSAKKAVAALAADANVVVLLSDLGLRETKRLVRAVPGIHFAVAGGLGEHPVVSDEAELVGATRVMQFHREGRFVGRLTLRMVDGSTDFADASAPSEAELAVLDQRIAELEKALARWAEDRPDSDRAVRSARHHLASLKDERARLGSSSARPESNRSTFDFRATALGWDLPQDPDILALMDAFNEELKRINLAHAGTLPEAKPGQAVYVGVAACLECHEEVQTFWDGDRHHKAWATLERDGKTFDAECVSCHVTGYGKAGGALVGQTKGREDVQCESCHGPGSLHAESDGDTDLIVTEPEEATCTICHNAHHSPQFDFKRYRKKLMVPGHGRLLP